MISYKREKLIETARQLFYQYGFHAVGIDLILKKSGVAKKTLYNHFYSKDDLILAVLRRNDEHFRNHFVRSLENRGFSAKEKLLSIFDTTEEWFTSSQFHGCIFINAIAEYSDRSVPIHTVCKEYKRTIRDCIAGLAREANASDPNELADQLSLLLEGATVTEQVGAIRKSAERAREIAIILINRACSLS